MSKKHSLFLKRVVLVPVTQADASIRNLYVISQCVNACAYKTEEKRSELRRRRSISRRTGGRVVSDTTFIPGD
jgi:hypothetical protein